MKKQSQITLLLLAMMVAFIGCDAAKDAANDATNKAADMANIDFGDFDMNAMKEKFTEVKDGFKNVTTDNVDGLTSKISDLSGSMDDMGIDKLTGPAKTAVGEMVSKFADAIKSAMDGISDESILSKLKPVVESLMEKINAYT